MKAVETNLEISLNSPVGKLFGGCTQRWQEIGEVLMPEPTALRLRLLSPYFKRVGSVIFTNFPTVQIYMGRVDLLNKRHLASA